MHVRLLNDKKVFGGNPVLFYFLVYVHARLLSLCPTLCDPMDCNRPDTSVHGILQARILEWVAISSSRESTGPGTEPESLMSPALAGGFFTTHAI